jgi:hypothetical protein
MQAIVKTRDRCVEDSVSGLGRLQFDGNAYLYPTIKQDESLMLRWL